MNIEPTEVIDHYAGSCKGCESSLEGLPSNGYRSSQQVEIPEIKPRVIEHRYHNVDCPNCGETTTAEASNEEKICCGPRLTGLIATLTTVYNLSRRNVQAIISSIMETDLSLGSIDNRVQEVGRALDEPVKELKSQLQKEESLHIDETGWKKSGKRMWAWVFVAKTLVFFHIDSSRGRKVLKSILGESFSGIIISDYYNVYRNYAKKWQTCLAHIIRKAKGLIEDDDKLVQAVGYLLKRELKLMIALWRKGRSKTPEMDECKARLKIICTDNI
ncbi:MAG: transposase [Nitrospirae bacterium]|nr:transposase [Nitrospirota bacterium]